jgi:tRNA nucleotidyltransferase/poly(A) polymerase
MSDEGWPNPALEADVPALECPVNVVAWLEKLPPHILEIASTVALHGGGIWIVGGAVRDVCLGIDVHDIDFAVSLEPQRMMEIFPDSIPTGIDYGTVSLRGDDGVFYEATTLRTESNYDDGRRPEQVSWGISLSEDLERRDFTINAMAIDIARKVMHDPHHGLQDMERGMLRAVGQAYRRISEDGLRILRAYRFLDRGKAGVWQFDFDLSEALRKNSHMLKAVTNERIWMEWLKILNGKNVAAVVEKMARDGILDCFLPGEWAAQHLRLAALEHPFIYDFDGLTRFALILAEFFSIEVDEALIELKLSKKQRTYILDLHNRFGTLPEESLASMRVFRAVLEPHAEQHLKLEVVLRSHGISPSGGSGNEDADTVYGLLEALETLTPLKRGHDSLIDGHWLMERTGIAKGKALGRLKAWLHRLQIERDLIDSAEVEAVLCSLHWTEENHLDWPKLQYPD